MEKGPPILRDILQPGYILENCMCNWVYTHAKLKKPLYACILYHYLAKRTIYLKYGILGKTNFTLTRKIAKGQTWLVALVDVGNCQGNLKTGPSENCVTYSVSWPQEAPKLPI